jgi:hypothetical protein
MTKAKWRRRIYEHISWLEFFIKVYYKKAAMCKSQQEPELADLDAPKKLKSKERWT